jgi:hypothetical protein
MPKPERASAPVRFVFWIAAETSNAPFAFNETHRRLAESEVNSNRSVSLGRQGRLDYVNFGTYVPRI